MKTMNGSTARTGKVADRTNADRVVWLMTYDESAAHSPWVSWAALGAEACTKMGAMLFSAMDTRTAFRRCMGVSTWTSTGLPDLTLVVDEGIDIGPLADAIIKRGKSVGVTLSVRARNEE